MFSAFRSSNYPGVNILSAMRHAVLCIILVGALAPTTGCTGPDLSLNAGDTKTSFTSKTTLAMDQLIAGRKDSSLFPTRSTVVPIDQEVAWKRTLSQFRTQREQIAYVNPIAGTIVTGLTRHGAIGFPHYALYYVVIEPEGDHLTRVTYKYFRYWKDYSEEPGHQLEFVLQPETNEHVYGIACREFENKLIRTLLVSTPGE